MGPTAAQLWALAEPGARATDEHFLSQVYQAELALRLEAPAGGAVLAATTGPDTFSVLLEARALVGAEAEAGRGAGGRAASQWGRAARVTCKAL
jgi:hypothetical protein